LASFFEDAHIDIEITTAPMLYELITVARPGPIREVKEVCRTAGSLILQRGGVIRGITNWGVFHLPNPTRGKKGKTTHHAGHYFIMRFDSDARTQHGLRRTLALEPRLLRYSVVKLGQKLGDIANVPGEVEEGRGAVPKSEFDDERVRRGEETRESFNKPAGTTFGIDAAPRNFKYGGTTLSASARR